MWQKAGFTDFFDILEAVKKQKNFNILFYEGSEGFDHCENYDGRGRKYK